MMKRDRSSFLSLIVLLSTLFIAFACSDNGEDVLSTPSKRTIRIQLEGDINGHEKLLSFNAFNTDGKLLNPINVETGEELSTYSLFDSNYDFTDSNTFGFPEKLDSLVVALKTMHKSEESKELTITMSFYLGGELEFAPQKKTTNYFNSAVFYYTFGKE